MKIWANHNIFEKGLVVEKTFIDKENLDIFIKKNSYKKLENGYFVINKCAIWNNKKFKKNINII